MAETLKIGDVFPIRSPKELEAEGRHFWEQIITIPELGIFLFDQKRQLRDGRYHWVSEDGTTRVTTHRGTIEQIETR